LPRIQKQASNLQQPFAKTLGRKNWLHLGSAQAGPKVAAIVSVVESCRRLGLPVKDYLTDILPGMNRRKLSEGRFRGSGRLRLSSLISCLLDSPCTKQFASVDADDPLCHLGRRSRSDA
jgi:hypothetical protein